MTRIPKHQRFKRKMRYLYHRMFPRRRSSMEVSWSVFLGIFIGVMPTIGIAIVLTLAVCRFSGLPSVPGVFASFVAVPPTQFGFFYPTAYFLGLQVIDPPPVSFDLLAKVEGMSLANFIAVSKWLWESSREHVVSFLFGITVVAVATGIIGFVIAFFIMEWKRKRLGVVNG